ncbi:hypothetical protein V2J09_022596 [Rumex salicifolius]
MRVEATGFVGGIWLLWNDRKIVVELQTVHNTRHQLWADLQNELQDVRDLLFTEGDFNYILSLEERQGRAVTLSPNSTMFSKWVNGLELIDLGALGPRFTWSKGTLAVTKVSKRLDRFFSNIDRGSRWEDARVHHLLATASDHNLILLSLEVRPGTNRGRRPFRFEVAWTLHPNFPDMIASHWNTPFARLELLDVWKHPQKARLIGIQKSLESRYQSGLVTLEEKLKRELEVFLEQEEAMWH